MKMEHERPAIDRFGLVQAYQKAANKEDFLYMLMNLEAVQAQSGMMAYIRQMLTTIREYARLRALSIAKGLILSIFPGKRKEESSKEYMRFEDTPEFAQQMDGLWRALGIDYDAYGDREVLRQYDEISSVLQEQGHTDVTIRHIEYDPESGIFSMPDIADEEGRTDAARWRSFAILSQSEYMRLTAYAEDKKDSEPNESTDEAAADHKENEIRAFSGELLSGDIIVNADLSVVREYLAKREADEIREEYREKEEEQENSEDTEQEKAASDSFSDWLDRIDAARERCEAMGLTRTADAAALFLQDHGLEKRKDSWVRIITSESGAVNEEPLTEGFEKGIDRDREARLLNMSYRKEALEKAEREKGQEKEMQQEQIIPARSRRTEIDR